MDKLSKVIITLIIIVVIISIVLSITIDNNYTLVEIKLKEETIIKSNKLNDVLIYIDNIIKTISDNLKLRNIK